MDSDLQLNIKSGGKKKKTFKKDDKTHTFSFVNNPVMEGKTVAKQRSKRPTITSKNNSFGFLTEKLDSESNTSKILEKSSKSNDKKLKKGRTYEELDISKIYEGHDCTVNERHASKADLNDDTDNFDCSDLSLNIKNVPSKAKSKKDSHAIQQNQNNEIKIKKTEVKKRSIHSHINSLFRNNPDIPILGQRLVKPVSEKVFSGKNFQDLDIHSFSVQNLEKNMKLKQLTVVQQKACPVILQGRDVLVRSQTGSGKTLAYALPIVEALQAIRPKLSRQDGIRALVIVPTRELALQTYELFVKLVKSFTWIVPGYLIGGEKRKAEKARIRKGFNILIGTPGRICDHIEHTASLTFGTTRCLVLDEADRLLDMGYEKDVSSIVETLAKHQAADRYDPIAIVRETVQKNHLHFGEKEGNREQIVKNAEYKHHLSNLLLSDKRQTILLSATLTKAVEALAGLTLENPVFIDASEGRAILIADSLTTKIPASVTEIGQNMANDKESKNQDEEEFEVVPLKISDNDEGNSSSEDDEENESDGDTSNVESDRSLDRYDLDDKQIDKSEVKLYKGVTAFAGTGNIVSVKDKIKKEKLKSESKGKKTIAKEKNIADEHSDSDSDYDFFAVSKVDIKAPKNETMIKHTSDVKDVTETKQKKVLTHNGNYDNAFQNALHNAVVQDEMVIPSSVTQSYILAPMKLRLITLSALIVERCVRPGSGKILIFMATQDMIDYHCELLSRVLAGREPHHIHVEDNTYSKRNKKHTKQKKDEPSEKQEASDSAKNKNKISEDSVDPKKTTESKGESGDEYEYKFDEMNLEDYEAKLRAEKAFVNVEFFQLHGSMNQKTRTEVFNTFRKATSGVLLCTTHPLHKSINRRLQNTSLNFEKKFNKYRKVKERLSNKIKNFTNICKVRVNRRSYNRIQDECVKKLKCARSCQNDNHSKDNYETQMLSDEKDMCSCISNIPHLFLTPKVEFFKLIEYADVSHKSRVVDSFSNASSGVLFSTDVAARGLDLPHVDCIVQYTGPISVTDYVHRVGRTARAGNVGMAVMILLPSEVEFIKQLGARRIRIFQEDMDHLHRSLLNDFDSNTNRKKHSTGGPTPVQLAAAELQSNYEELVKGNKDLYMKACKAFTSWLRFYSTYPREARVAFDRRALHIGHAATALALTDTPKKIGKEAPKAVNRKDSDLKRRAEKEKGKPKVKTPTVKSIQRGKRMLVSEYESGLEPLRKKGKK